jgi:3',5'-cyclic AMP phosphodiesterase CpdA
MHFDNSRVQGYVQYVADIGEIHLIAIDGQDPGSGGGSLDGGRLEWLERQLAAAPERPTIVALHRPPFAVGVVGPDGVGLGPGDALALRRIVARHRQVQRVICGHVHRVVAGDLAGRVTITAPSAYVELDPDFHKLVGDPVVTHSEALH